MISRKYSKDYKLSHIIQENGKIKTNVEYIGQKYDVTGNEENFKKNCKMFAVLVALCWIFFICALIPQSNSSRTFYVIVPFAACSMPLFLLSGLVIDFFCMKFPVTRMQADKINRRLPARSFVLMLLSGISFFGFSISCLINFKNMIMGDLFYGISSFCIFILSALIFGRRKKISVKEKK